MKRIDVQEIVQYVKDHFSDPNICLPMVADQFGLHKNTVSAALRSADCGYDQLLASLRIEKAKQLLSGSDLPIADVGRAIGYATSSHFSVYFRKHTGIHPSVFRTNCRTPQSSTN